MTATYQEMLSTGGLSRIDNEELRNALVRYGQNAERFELLYGPTIGLISNTASPNTVLSATRRSMDLSVPDDQSLVISYDWRKLQAAEPQIFSIWVHQNILSRVANTQLTEVRNILALLEAETP